VVGRSQPAVAAVLEADFTLTAATCNAGRTALEMATARGYPQIAALLQGLDPASVGPDRYCWPRHQTHFEVTFLEFNGIL
jgi:hypothetical protein